VAWCIPSPFAMGDPFLVQIPKSRLIVYDNFYAYVYE